MVWKWLKKNIRKRRGGYTLTDEDRAKGALTRRMKKIQADRLDAMERRMQDLEIQRMEVEMQERIHAMERDLHDDDEDDDEESDGVEEQLLGAILNKVMPSPGVQPGQPMPGQQMMFSEDEIRIMISQLPKAQIKMFKRLPDVTKRKLIKGYMPSVDEESITIALNILNE